MSDWRSYVDTFYSDGIEAFYEQGGDAALDESLDPRGPDLMFEIAAELGLSNRDRLLDVGARDGRHLDALRERFGCTVTGVEPAVGNLARMRRTHPAATRSVARGIAEALPFADRAFDFVWINDVLGHVAPLGDAFAECRRVLRPGAPLLVFNVFATDALEPREAQELWAMTAVAPGTADREAFERAATGAGFAIERREELGGERLEFVEERGDRKTSRQLLRVARMRREPERYRAALGDHLYAVELGNCLYGVYQLLGKLSAAICVLR